MRKCTFTRLANEAGGTVTLTGQFHAWTRDVRGDGKIVPKAIVEDDDGNVYLVPPHVVKFVPVPPAPCPVDTESELIAIAKRIEGRFNSATIGFDGFLHQMHTTFDQTLNRIADIIYSRR